MVRLVSILAALYLAVAPGMNVASLLHSVELCHFFGAHAAHDHHEDEDDSPDRHDCPDCDNLIVERAVITTGAVQADLQAVEPFRVVIPDASPRAAAGDPQSRERPPPWPYVGVIRILV